MPPEARVVLNARTLATAHRRLAALLAPGLAVLDVGCGTGAITRGIADAVAPGGHAVGLDQDRVLVAEARVAHRAASGLSFVVGDAYALPVTASFDIVTAARVLQWLASPEAALAAMAAAARPGGRIVVLDFNHEKHAWTPALPPPARCFHEAFLGWRAEAGLDNAMGDHLAAMARRVGLSGITCTAEHEIVQRGEPDFDVHVGLWAEVAATRGHQMVTDGVITEADRAAGEAGFRAWGRTAEAQALHLMAIEGVRAP
jgi:SAM-dependent methyltransferase